MGSDINFSSQLSQKIMMLGRIPQNLSELQWKKV